ncbi:MAG: M24 family metallopeptidase, partial [bacterium]
MSKINIKTEEEIAGMREAGRCAAEVLDAVKQKVAPGVSTWDLDQFAKSVMDSLGAVSTAYGYGDKKNPYPSYICISLNDEIVHGI